MNTQSPDHTKDIPLLDALLRAFVEQRRMKIAGDYKPCYRVVT